MWSDAPESIYQHFASALQRVARLYDERADGIAIIENKKPENSSFPEAPCVPCIQGKLKTKIIRLPQTRASRPLELIHSDLFRFRTVDQDI